jgi:hypothetical protein
MAERIVEEHVHTVGGGNQVITALVVVILMVVLVAVLYFTGVLAEVFGKRDTKIDVDINTPPGIVLRVAS